MLNKIKRLAHPLLRPSPGRTFFSRIFAVACIFALFLSCNRSTTSSDAISHNVAESSPTHSEKLHSEHSAQLSAAPIQLEAKQNSVIDTPTVRHSNAPHSNTPTANEHSAHPTPLSATHSYPENSNLEHSSSEPSSPKQTVAAEPSDIDPSLSVASTSTLVPRPKANQPQIAIIIDDIGYRRDEGEALIELPYALSFAFIPFSPYGTQLAELANEHNKAVMLHAPMATLNESKWEDSLNPNMERAGLIAHLDSMLADIPHAAGVNNHGGSLFTQDVQGMQWLSEALAERDLYFIDSRTTAQSVAREQAERAKIPFNERDVFLDNEREVEAIEAQLDQLIAIALKHGHAIAIGHPYPETLTALESRLPLLTEQGVELVHIEQLLPIKANTLTHNSSPTNLKKVN